MRFAAFVCLLWVAACSYVSPLTVARLSAMSPLTADPGGIEVVVMIPDGVRLAEGAAYMDLDAYRSDTGERLREHIALDRVDDGSTILWRIPEEDLDRLRKAQKTVAAWEAEVPDASSGSFSVGLRQCFEGRQPEPDDVFSIAIRTEKQGPLRPLMRDVPFAKLYEQLDHSGGPAQDCGG